MSWYEIYSQLIALRYRDGTGSCLWMCVCLPLWMPRSDHYAWVPGVLSTELKCLGLYEPDHTSTPPTDFIYLWWLVTHAVFQSQRHSTWLLLAIGTEGPRCNNGLFSTVFQGLLETNCLSASILIFCSLPTPSVMACNCIDNKACNCLLHLFNMFTLSAMWQWYHS